MQYTRINSFALSPRYLQVLVRGGIKPNQTHKLTSLSTVFSAAAPLKAALYEYIRDCIGPVFVNNCSGTREISPFRERGYHD